MRAASAAQDVQKSVIDRHVPSPVVLRGIYVLAVHPICLYSAAIATDLSIAGTFPLNLLPWKTVQSLRSCRGDEYLGFEFYAFIPPPRRSGFRRKQPCSIQNARYAHARKPIMARSYDRFLGYWASERFVGSFGVQKAALALIPEHMALAGAGVSLTSQRQTLHPGVCCNSDRNPKPVLQNRRVPADPFGDGAKTCHA